MKTCRLSTAMIALLACFVAAFASGNVAYQDQNVRFTLITNGLVRLEWSPNGLFVDDPSFVAINRQYPEVKYTVKKSGGKVTISTDMMTIKYKTGDKQLDKSNLSITSAKGVKPAFDWHPGMKQTGNLGGTFRTLDGMDGNLAWDPVTDTMFEVEMPDGLLATDGWTLIDDSDNFLFDDSDWQWVKQRSTEGQDWHFMAYGHDYKKALADFAILAGKMPLPPRYAFGYWWSRYYAYTDNELRKLISNFEQYDIPVDVLVIDMDWHNTDEGRGSWTGFTWNDRLFPDYRKLLQYIHDKDLKITLNIHPAEGVRYYETQYADMARDLGIDPASHQDIDWTSSDKRFMASAFDRIFHPYQKDGVDFWWLDWQQHPFDKKVDNLSNTWWLNYCFFTDKERNGDTRPMLYHRWGGLGNHRYQIGFSGDSKISWESLDYQPYFNSTASNVLYGYWSHDIGGHHQGEIIPEMYIRWMQFGALSPILRTHSTKSAILNKEPWAFDAENMATIIDIIRQRYAMVPYIYTMARKAYDTSVALCRPMYYDYPDAPESYELKNQYMYGDDMLVAPITAPMEGVYSSQEVWLPEGNDWYELHTGTLLKGGQKTNRMFLLDEYPVYVKAGSIIPMYSANPRKLNNNDEPIEVVIYPGADNGSFSLYEDAGNSKDYGTQYATTLLSYSREGSNLHVRIDPRIGQYDSMPDKHDYSLRIEGSIAPESVTVNGKKADFSYDGPTLSVLVNLGEIDCSKGEIVEINFGNEDYQIADGSKARLKHGVKAISNLIKSKPHIVLNDDLGIIETTGIGLTYNPTDAKAKLARFNDAYARIPAILKSHDLSSDLIEDFTALTTN